MLRKLIDWLLRKKKPVINSLYVILVLRLRQERTLQNNYGPFDIRVPFHLMDEFSKRYMELRTGIDNPTTIHERLLKIDTIKGICYDKDAKRIELINT